jgi:hypothetical protein
MEVKKFDNSNELLVEFNKSLKRKVLGKNPDAGIIGHRIIIDNIPQRPVFSSRYTTLRKDGEIISQYRKCIGFEPM